MEDMIIAVMKQLKPCEAIKATTMIISSIHTYYFGHHMLTSQMLRASFINQSVFRGGFYTTIYERKLVIGTHVTCCQAQATSH